MNNTNNIFGLILLVLFGGTGMVSIFAIVNLLLPAPVERVRTVIETGMVRSLLLGFVNSLFAGLLVFLFAIPVKAGGIIAGIFVLLIGIVFLIIAVLVILGIAASTSLLGNRIGEAKSSVTTHMRGSVLLLLACLTPYLGWFIFAPLVIWISLGATIQTLFKKKAVMPIDAP